MKLLLNTGNEILKLKRELQECVLQENYKRAIEVRNEIKRHELKRDNLDAVYETSRFEELILMGDPSEEFVKLTEQIL
jgi:hypothetical protein